MGKNRGEKSRDNVLFNHQVVCLPSSGSFELIRKNYKPILLDSGIVEYGSQPICIRILLTRLHYINVTEKCFLL
jgi:hypothetical protein